MIKIVGLFPLTTNGGISSWAKKYIKIFPDDEFYIYPVNISPSVPRLSDTGGLWMRIVTGIKAERRIIKELKTLFEKEHFDILHTTTSGSLGSYRDYKVAKLCKRYGVKTVMHCRYGCITEDIKSKGLVGILLRKAMQLFDQIWVLDSRSYTTIKSIPSLQLKVHLTPNSIEVVKEMDTGRKLFNKVAFIGNLMPSKGLYELITACCQTNTRLDIVGPGTEKVIAKIKEIANDNLNNNVFLHGKLSNEESLSLMRDVDILALPTYYQYEAFPMSIIEAMSLTKMVISCPRAAIQDMLTDSDGRKCGLLVEPRSSDAIANAITWCQNNKNDANQICQNAYIKVKKSYSTQVVYELYRENYRMLMSK